MSNLFFDHEIIEKKVDSLGNSIKNILQSYQTFIFIDISYEKYGKYVTVIKKYR